MERQNETPAIPDYIHPTIKRKIGDVNYFTNDSNNNVLNNFDDVIPKYDEEHDEVYLEIHPETKGQEYSKIILRENIYEGLNDYGKEYTKKEFVEKKTDFVCNKLLRAVSEQGYDKPSDTQRISVVPLIQGKDVIMQAKSGTGKTTAVLLGALWHLNPECPTLQYIFLTHTRDLAKQTFEIIKKYLPNLNIALCIGEGNKMGGTVGMKKTGSSIAEQRKEVEKAQVIVGTIGRIFDFIVSKQLVKGRLECMRAIVIDEFDDILNDSHQTKCKEGDNALTTIDQVMEIFDYVFRNCHEKFVQRIFFSASIEYGALQKAITLLRDCSNEAFRRVVGYPYIMVLDDTDQTLKGINHFYVLCDDNNAKIETLDDIITNVAFAKAIIFCRTKETAQYVAQFLNEKKQIATKSFTGDLSNDERDLIWKKFKGEITTEEIKIIVTVDIASRGIDVQGLNFVINYDMPRSIETYLHRIGRSGRYGRKGLAINFILNGSGGSRGKMNKEAINETPMIDDINKISNENLITELRSDNLKILNNCT